MRSRYRTSVSLVPSHRKSFKPQHGLEAEALGLQSVVGSGVLKASPSQVVAMVF